MTWKYFSLRGCLAPQDGKQVWNENVRDPVSPVVTNGKSIINIVNINGSMNFVGLCLDCQLGREKTLKEKDRDVFEASPMVVAHLDDDHTGPICGFLIDSFVAGEYPEIGWGL